MDFFLKEEYTIKDIQLLIDSETEESLHLEFKEARALSKEEKNKTEITKDVSAFANSDGGIIIYGIQEKEHKASHITNINGNIYTKEWLELVINNGIYRRIPNLKIYPVHEEGDLSKTVYIVKIPHSIEVPHMNKDKLYYKRFNFQAVRMEEYEVRQLYYRKNKAILDISNCSLRRCDEQDCIGSIKMQLTILLENIGEIYETEYKTQIRIKGGINMISDIHKIHSKADFICLYDNEDMVLTMNSSIFETIYPKEKLLGASFYLLIDNNNISDFINTCIIDIKIFYSNGSKERENTYIKDIISNVIIK